MRERRCLYFMRTSIATVRNTRSFRVLKMGEARECTKDDIASMSNSILGQNKMCREDPSCSQDFYYKLPPLANQLHGFFLFFFLINKLYLLFPMPFLFRYMRLVLKIHKYIHDSRRKSLGKLDSKVPGHNLFHNVFSLRKEKKEKNVA